MMRSISILLLCLFVLLAGDVLASESTDEGKGARHDDVSVMQAFAEQQAKEGDAVKISDREKHQWLFVMGVTLLLLLLTTAALGIAMAIYGKQVFAAHMLTAGLSLTLAAAHAVAAIVWFNPF